MGAVTVETIIRAPIELCFDVARDVDAHAKSAAFSSERVVEPGRLHGLLELGDLVAFEGRHFGIRQRFVAKITALNPPHVFVDEMVEGAFKSLRHVHQFQSQDEITTMRDILEWQTPFGIVGVVADRLFVSAHMRRFVNTKQSNLKADHRIPRSRRRCLAHLHGKYLPIPMLETACGLASLLRNFP
jgi:ligand-binding SRPBCC domain-containing protein